MGTTPTEALYGRKRGRPKTLTKREQERRSLLRYLDAKRVKDANWPAREGMRGHRS